MGLPKMRSESVIPPVTIFSEQGSEEPRKRSRPSTPSESTSSEIEGNHQTHDQGDPHPRKPGSNSTHSKHSSKSPAHPFPPTLPSLSALQLYSPSRSECEYHASHMATRISASPVSVLSIANLLTRDAANDRHIAPPSSAPAPKLTLPPPLPPLPPLPSVIASARASLSPIKLSANPDTPLFPSWQSSADGSSSARSSTSTSSLPQPEGFRPTSDLQHTDSHKR